MVHVDHGIGRFHGLGGDHRGGAAHECLLLEYAENSKLYLPVENIELLSKYGHEEGLLGQAWAAARGRRRKAKLKERIREMADELIRVAAERALRTAPVLDRHRACGMRSARGSPMQKPTISCAHRDVIDDLASGRRWTV